MTLESRTHQGLDPLGGLDAPISWSTEQLTDYSLVGDELAATWRAGWDSKENGADNWWMRATASFSVSSSQWAQTGLQSATGPGNFVLPYLYAGLEFEVHIRSLAPTSRGIMYGSLVGFDGHFTLAPIVQEEDLGFEIVAANGTRRCFFGEKTTSETPAFYFWASIRIDSDCDGVTDGTMDVTPD